MADTIPEGAIPADQFEGAQSATSAQHLSPEEKLAQDYNPQHSLTPSSLQGIPQDTMDFSASQPSEEQIPEGAIPEDEFQSQQDYYGSPSQQALAGLEAVGRGVVGPLAPAAERMLGVNPDNIRAREEANPWTSGLGEFGGFTAGLLTGTGEAAAITKTGEAAAKLAGFGKVLDYGEQLAKLTSEGLSRSEATAKLAEAGIAAPSLIAKVGSTAVKDAAEFAAFNAADEASRVVVQDPNVSAETALANIGLGAALGATGGAFLEGAVNPLWKATIGDKVGNLLENLKTRLNGSGTSDLVNKANNLGVKMEPEVEAAMSEDPFLKNIASKLEQTDTTKAGRDFQSALSNFKKDVSDKVIEIAGKNPSDIGNLETSNYETGKDLAETMANSFEKNLSQPIRDLEQVKSAIADEPLIPDNIVKTKDYTNPYMPTDVVTEVPGTIKTLSDKIAKLAINNDWLSVPTSEEARLVRGTLKQLKNKGTVGDLVKLAENIGKNTKSTAPFGVQTPLSRAGTMIKGIINDSVDEVTTAKLGDKAPEMLNRFLAAKEEFKQVAKLKEAIDESIRAGGSVSGYPNSLRAFGRENGEAALNRMTGIGDARFLQLVTQEFPEVAEKLKKYHVDRLVKNSLKTVEGETALDTKKFLKNLFNSKSMSPELRDFIFSKEQQDKFINANDLIQKLEDRTHNWSNTARTIDKLTEHFGGSALGAVAFLTGHDALGLLMPFLGSFGKETADAGRIGLLKFLGSEQPVNAAGFKTAVDYAENVIKGHNSLIKAIKNIFNSGSKVISGHAMPNLSERNKLDKKIDYYTEHPQALVELTNGNLGHYMPEAQTALTAATVRNINYLKTLKPQPSQTSPLDKSIKPSAVEISRYNRALDIAINPSIVLHAIKNGTLQQSDMQDVHSMYPSLYQTMVNHLSNEIAGVKGKDIQIPYKTRMALSLFMGQPLDNTMIPTSIMAAQPQQAPPLPAQPKIQGGNKGSLKNIGKIGQNYSTPLQAMEQHKAQKA